MATATPNIGLNVVPSGDYTKYFDEWRKEMASDEDTSNMMKIDAAIGSLNDDMASVKQNKQDKLTFDTAPTAGSTNPVTSGGVETELNKKSDVAVLSAHTGNTNNPHDVTAEQVGADASGTAATTVSAHNVSDSAHSDIRTSISTLSTVVDGKQDAATLESDVQAAGFTKNEGTYVKPASGIPKTDLASDVQNVLTSAAKIASGTYTGTGTCGADNPNSLTFDFEPKVVFIQGATHGQGETAIFVWGTPFAVKMGPNWSTKTASLFTIYSGNTMSWYSTAIDADSQLNKGLGSTYSYVAIG